jgi:uncharacterized membrane protein
VSWIQRHRFRHYLTNSIWIVPLASMVLGIVVARMTFGLDVRFVGQRSSYDPETVRTVLITLAGVVFTLIVFINSALLIALQLASAQLTPRVIAMLFRDPVTKAALTLFVFAFAFTLTVALSIDTGTGAPAMTTRAAAYGSVASLAVFLYLVDHIGRSLRPGIVLRRVGRLGRTVIKQVYPRLLADAPERPQEQVAAQRAGDPARAVSATKDGVVLAFDIDGLRAIAQRADCVIELVPQVGDYVAVGDPLFRIFGPAQQLGDDQLLASVATGQERTLEQDPSFAFRIVVDVASKALSPAINDPTTAVLAIDQLHRLLRHVGMRCLDEERVRDASGRLRLVYRTPDWADFVQLAVTEIRHFGGESIQIVRRLRAMLQNLIQTLPEPRVALLQQELELLDKSTQRAFSDPEDCARAQVADPQGVGSRRQHVGAAPTTSDQSRMQRAAAPQS